MIIIFRDPHLLMPPTAFPHWLQPPPYFLFLYLCSSVEANLMKPVTGSVCSEIKQHFLIGIRPPHFSCWLWLRSEMCGNSACSTGLSGFGRNLILCMFTQECLIINRHSHYWNSGHNRNKRKEKGATGENVLGMRQPTNFPAIKGGSIRLPFFFMRGQSNISRGRLKGAQ